MAGSLHFYSADVPERRYVHVVLAVCAILLAYALGSITKTFSIQIPWWLDAPAVFGFYGIVYNLFNRSFWKSGIVRKALFLKIPILQGQYAGYLKSSHDKFKKKTKIEATVIQTWDRIMLSIETNQSKSHSVTAAFHISDRLAPQLIYYYCNTPFSASIQTMHIHKGIAEVSCEGETLKGEFFTGRDRKTFGEFTLIKKP